MQNANITLIQETLIRHGFQHFGWTRLERPFSFEHYREWIQAGLHADMKYLADHLPQKEEPVKLLPQARSAIVITENYLPHPEPRENDLKALPIARYARGRDYHIYLKRKLNEVIQSLAAHMPESVFLPMTDSSPVLERDLAWKAGLGWFGKNTCLIHPKRGSLFFIAEIYTSLALETEMKVQPDHCGTCTRCLDACPTGALIAPRKLDAAKCISYLTIEAKNSPPESLRSKVGEWFFGCDICQTVCPWNEKVFGAELRDAKNTDREQLVQEIRMILSESNNSLSRLFKDSPLLRAGAKGLKRNAILVAVHHKLVELCELIAETGKTLPQLAELSDWAVQQLNDER